MCFCLQTCCLEPDLLSLNTKPLPPTHIHPIICPLPTQAGAGHTLRLDEHLRTTKERQQQASTDR